VRTAGLILAAGAGTRYGQPKAPVEIDGERLVDRAVRILRQGGCDPIVVVLGAWVGPVQGARVVVNRNWAEGMGSSLRAGIDALTDSETTHALVTLVDLPGLTPTAVLRVASTSASLAVATYDGVRGHPVLMAREHWAGVSAAAAGDVGARSYLIGREDLVLVEVGDVAVGYDLDVPAET
jgi:CTP:molybdopterin cytidylyltransferase MocA